MPVFFGTNRKQAAGGTDFGPERASEVAIGRAIVTIPKSARMGAIERPSVWKLTTKEDPAIHHAVKELKIFGEDRFVGAVRDSVHDARLFQHEALVYIHGTNVTFKDAVLRAAQFSYDLRFDGALLAFSWPSTGGVTGYHIDRDNSYTSAPELRRFLKVILAEARAKNVHLIAQGMGTLPLLEALRSLEHDKSIAKDARFGQIVLITPDVGSDDFQRLAPGVVGISAGITLYAANSDVAIRAARQVKGYPIAGDVPADGPVVVAGVDTVDVSNVSNDFLSLNSFGLCRQSGSSSGHRAAAANGPTTT